MRQAPVNLGFGYLHLCVLYLDNDVHWEIPRL